MTTSKNDNTMHLISNITHQAINPLSGVLGTLDNVIDGTISKDRRTQRLRSARAQLEYTISLIRNLAYFAQYGGEEVDKKAIVTKKTVIPQNIIEAAMFFQEQGENIGLRIEVLDRHIQNAVKCDPDLIRQVFMNIIDNYIKYGEKDSVVEIKHWIQRKTNILIVTFEGKSTPFNNDEDIFKLGVRGNEARDKTSAGSGLGLHICRLIISRILDGTITAEYYHKKMVAHFEIRIPNAFIIER